MNASVVIMPIKKINIIKDQLEDYYLQQKLSTGAIAKILKCNHVTVLNYLKKFRIPRRSKLGNRKPVSIPREILYDLYWNKKLTHKQIAQQFGHSRYGIQRWMKIYNIQKKTYYETHKVYPKSNFSGDLIEKAYLIGFRLGDLNVSQVRNLIQARCSTTIEAQVNLFRLIFSAYGNVHVWKAKRGTWEMITLLNTTFKFLVPKNDKVEEWILNNKKTFLSFLAGYSDAEGCILIRKSNHGNKVPFAGFELATYDKHILKQIELRLRDLELVFPTTFITRKAGVYNGQRNNKDCWRISIYRKDSLWKLLSMLHPYMKHENKLKSLARAKENLIMRNSIAYGKRVDLRA